MYLFMKYAIKYFARLIIDTIHFIFVMLFQCIKGNLSNPIKKVFNGTVAVLANGPSLNLIKNRLIEGTAFNGVDFIVMNNFALDAELFLKIKPKHYVFVDRLFFKENVNADKKTSINDLQRTFKTLQEKVDWMIYIYVPIEYRNSFIQFSNINNTKISIIGINNYVYQGHVFFRNFLYKNGLSFPGAFNVLIFVIYICINSGYKNIMLYGADYDFTKNCFVNEKNELWRSIKHYYDNDSKSEFKGEHIVMSGSGIPYTFERYYENLLYTYKCHRFLQCYAKSLGVNIINCTHHSMLDTYKRIPLNIEPHEVENIISCYGNEVSYNESCSINTNKNE